ncbi:hypothetical protein [Acidithiobacillus sp.]|jgi:hypothetical protein|uniref:hypothetical protein n=1 Tax=Acidithiobacillus sp. TaxID=1872118 RepID=UPI003566329C
MTLAQQLREAILAAPLETSNFAETPQAGTLYLPPSHLKALRLDAHIVVGGRGVGKSFWTAALQSNPLRKQLGAAVTELQDIEVSAGFSNAEAIENYPNADVFAAFLDQNGAPYDLWRAVILRWVALKAAESIPNASWQATVDWLKQKPEDAARLMQRPRGWKGLILFDALDRTSTDWRRMDDIVRGLLRAALWLKAFPGLYAKVFLREDQAERTVFNFPDASKLTATKSDLAWARHDLHGLLWQRLINAPGTHGEQMRSVCTNIEQDAVWHIATDMKSESEAQKKAFEALAGPWMGRDRRRGVPYTWSVGHLADGRGQTSPRSFLAAIRRAAEDSSERYPQHDYALHFESIKRGIQKASEIRVQEIAEDYPWVPDVLTTLSGMNVPIDFDAVIAKWEEKFPGGAQGISTTQLPAQHVDRGWDGVREDLQRLGLLEVRKDGRIDMPDLYRVGFGLGRRGGVKPKN